MPTFITSSTKVARQRQGTQAREEQGFPFGKMQTVLQTDVSGSSSTASIRSRPLSSVLTDGNEVKSVSHTFSRQNKCKKRKNAHGFQPRSCGFTYRMPARETVAGVAVLRWWVSNRSLMEGVRATRSLLARVSTCVSRRGHCQRQVTIRSQNSS